MVDQTEGVRGNPGSPNGSVPFESGGPRYSRLDALRGRGSELSDIVPWIVGGSLIYLFILVLAGSGTFVAGSLMYAPLVWWIVHNRVMKYYADRGSPSEAAAIDELRTWYAEGWIDEAEFERRVARVYEEGPETVWTTRDTRSRSGENRDARHQQSGNRNTHRRQSRNRNTHRRQSRNRNTRRRQSRNQNTRRRQSRSRNSRRRQSRNRNTRRRQSRNQSTRRRQSRSHGTSRDHRENQNNHRRQSGNKNTRRRQSRNRGTRRKWSGDHDADRSTTAPVDAVRILGERYARGEIDAEEYRHRLRVLASDDEWETSGDRSEDGTPGAGTSDVEALRARYVEGEITLQEFQRRVEGAFGEGTDPDADAPDRTRPVDRKHVAILRERFARGEIDAEEYRRRRRVLAEPIETVPETGTETNTDTETGTETQTDRLTERGT